MSEVFNKNWKEENQQPRDKLHKVYDTLSNSIFWNKLGKRKNPAPPEG